MKFLKINFIFIMAVAALAQVQEEETKYGAAFLDIGIGARALALGSAFSAEADDGSGFYWNPAGSAFLARPQVSAMYAEMFNSLENHGFASVAVPIFGNTVLAASWIRLAVEGIPRYDDNNLYNFEKDERYANPETDGLTAPALDQFNFTNNAYYITVSKLNRWNVDLGWQYFEIPMDFGYGVNFKMINMNLYDRSGSGLGLDAGVRLKMGLNDLFADDNFGYFSLGLAVFDLFNTSITWDTDSKQKDYIERMWRFGFAFMQPLNFANSQLFILYDLDTKYDGHWHLGTEILYESMFALRVGTNDGSFTAGAGIAYWKFKIDYAYQNYDLGNTHRVGLTFAF
jgi:hypothetical protein